MSKEFYKMRLIPTEEGLTVWTDTWISIHETPCFHYCIQEHNKSYLSAPMNIHGKPNLQVAKGYRLKIKRVDKRASRFAFDTKEGAFKHLQFLKRKQLNHMKRDISFIERFLSDTSDGVPVELISNTVDLVNGHFIFD